VSVVNVREVRVTVNQLLVTVPVRVRLSGRVSRPVRVLMMRIVRVQMLMLHRLMPVLVPVPFRQMEPDPSPHQNGRHSDAERHPVAQQQNRNQRPHKRSQR
jgi:hypothetical protein